jgi:MerR family transcriptional regulator, redox-sensitive transcriptional activator SoxR
MVEHFRSLPISASRCLRSPAFSEQVIGSASVYEREGLLPEPERVSGQRRFTEETVQRLGIIDVAKQAGFSLEEVGVLLASIDQGAPAHEQLQALAARKLPEVDALIARAEAVREWLTTASACGCDSLASCALFVTDPKPLQIEASAEARTG